MQDKIIEKWYQFLNFPAIYNTEFLNILKSADHLKFTNITEHDPKLYTPEENLLAYLYFCEDLYQQYQEKSIPDSIFEDTVHDIVIWTNTYYSIYGKLGLAETNWLRRHLRFSLFKIGRLQFCMNGSEFDIPEIQIKAGDPIMEVHIPEGEGLNYDKCLQSFRQADLFFQKYYPDYQYEYFTCHSWLLDSTLLNYLKPSSNIIAFQSLFSPIQHDASDALLKYIFRWDANRENLTQFEPASHLAKEIRSAIENNVQFYETFGVRKHN